jgi:hypothetical protein
LIQKNMKPRSVPDEKTLLRNPGTTPGGKEKK